MDIYSFGNSTNDVVSTYAKLRGKIKPGLWDPYTGETTSIEKPEYVKRTGQVYTRFPLKLDPVKSVFVIGE